MSTEPDPISIDDAPAPAPADTGAPSSEAAPEASVDDPAEPEFRHPGEAVVAQLAQLHACLETGRTGPAPTPVELAVLNVSANLYQGTAELITLTETVLVLNNNLARTQQHLGDAVSRVEARLHKLLDVMTPEMVINLLLGIKPGDEVPQAKARKAKAKAKAKAKPGKRGR